MNLFNPSKTNLDELVFEQRNKAYGAYAIRKAYPDHLNRSMAITLAPLLFFLLTALIWNYFRPLPLDRFIPVPAPVKKPPLTDIITCGGGFTFILDDPTAGFRIVIDRQVKPIPRKREVIKPIEPNHAHTGQTGLPAMPNLGGMGLIGNGGTGIHTGSGTGTGDPEIIGFDAQVMPEFPGGQEAMYEYIRKNLNYPRLAIDNGIQGKVVLSFVIMPDGSVQMTHLERGIGFGCDEEAMRVVNEMPNWEPAKQNGHQVPIRMILPVIFQTN